MNHRSYIVAILLLCAFLMLLGGCGSTDPSRFYLLSLSEESGATGQDLEQGLSIEIGPVKFPAYLDRQQIVVRTNRNELRLAEFDRWAEPLEANFTRVLAGNLSDLLSTNRITLFSNRLCMPLAYRVVLDVTRFEGGPDGTVTLDACWTLFKGNEDQVILMQKSSIRKPAGGEDEYAALVSAKSDALGDLSREIADCIAAQEKKATEKRSSVE